MRRRRLFTIVSAFSALLFFLLAGLWVRTFFTSDELRVGRSAADGTRHADVHVRWGGSFATVTIGRWTDWGMEDPWPETRRRFAGLRWSHDVTPATLQGIDAWLWWDHYIDQPSGGGANEVWHVQFRPWLILLPSMILPAVWLNRFMRRQRMLRQGLCLECGYDLRATSGRCPECGTERVNAHTVTPNRSQNVSEVSAKSGLM